MRTKTTFLAAGVAMVALFACDRPQDGDGDTSAATASQKAQKKTSSGEEGTADGEASGDDSTTSTKAEWAKNWRANDVHTHLGPQGVPVVERILEQNRVYRVVNLSGGSGAEQRRVQLKAAGELSDRIALFMNVDWDGVEEEDFGEQMAQRLEAAVADGYAGLKISKSLGLKVKGEEGELLPVDTSKLDPLWEKAGELGVPVTIHTADPKAFFEKPGPENERWKELKQAPDWSWYGDEYPSRASLLEARDRLVERHSDTTFILAHMANNPEDMDYVANLLENHDNVYVDTSARIAEFGRHAAADIREFFIRFQDRILFGTDLGVHAKRTKRGLAYSLFLGSIREEPPDLDDVPVFFERHWRYFESDADEAVHPIPIQGDWKVHPIDLPREVLEKVYWKNAERVVFAPWLGRRAAHAAADAARRVAGGG